jgi:hypothetical protein
MQNESEGQFVVVSGLPGSGKSVLARRLGPLLNLPVIDKDDILERLFETKGVGDAAWRRTLSRESDLLFRRQAEGSNGAILVSFWRLGGMSSTSGTPTDWLFGLPGQIVNVHCECPPELAVTRFAERKRHPGHLDDARSGEQLLAAFRAIACLPRLAIRRTVHVDTSVELDYLDLLARIRCA